MIIDNLFENKKNINESLADEFMAMAKAKGYNPRLRGTPDEERARTDAMLAQRAADRAAAPAPAAVSDEERAKLEAQLQRLQAEFDPDYEFSDDHSFWTQQKSIAQQIGAIKQKLSQGLTEGYETTPFGGVTNTTPNYSQAWKVTDEGEEFLRKAYQRLKRAYKEGGQVEMINIGPALSELQQQKFGPAYVQQSGPYQMMTTDISRLIEKIEPWQKQYNQQHIATDFDPEDFSNWNKQQGMSENTGRKVDAKGRTQSEWMQAVKQKFPDARIVQAKMIDGPAHALLPDGRKFSWTPVQGVTEAIHIDVDLVRAVFYVAKEIYDGAKAGNDMTDTIADELGDYFDDVEQSGLPKLKRAYAAMRDTADEDPNIQKRAAGDALLTLNTLIRQGTDRLRRQGMAEANASTASFRASNAKRAKLNAMSPEERKEYDKEQAEKQRKRDDARLEKERQKLAAKKGVAENKRNNKRKLDESWLMEDPVYRKFKKVGRYIAERKLTEPEILKIFADAETGMTDKATGANRTFLGRGKDTTMDFAGGVADALKGVWSGLQSSTPISFVDVAYDKATDALADLTGGEKGAIMQAIKKYRMLAKEYPKTAGLAKGALVAITGLATGGAGLPAVAALVYGLDSAVKGDKFSDIALKAGGAAATAWAASKIASMFGGNQPAGADAGGMGDPSQLPPFDDAGNLSPGFHISPDDKMPYYTGDLAPTPTDIAAGYGPDGVAGLTGAEAAGASRFDDIVKNAIDYKIKDGDTLTQILADKKINPEAFKRLPGNEVYFGPDGNPDVIKAGATIKLPRPEDVGTLNRMSFTTPDAAGGNLQRFLDDPDAYTGLYNPNNNRFSLDAATNLKQQELGRYASSDIAANRVAQDAARAGGGPELLGGPGAGDVASPVADVAASAAVPAPSPLNLQPAATPGGPQFGTVTLPDGQTLKAAAFPEGGGITPRLPVGSTPVTINYNGQELTGRIVNDTVYFTKFPAAPQISPADIRPFGSGAPDTSLLSTPGGYGGTLSGVTADQIYNNPVYQQIYAQEIAKYGAEPSARAIQTAQQIATMKAKAAMAGAVREATEFTRTVKMRQLPVDKLIDQKLTTLSWALNESVGKPQGRSMHLTPLGVYTVFENIRRVGEAAVADSEADAISRSRRRSATTVPLNPTPAPAPAPTPAPAPAPTAPTGDAAGPGREALPDLLRPDMADAPTQPADPAKKSWFGKGLDYLDRGVKKVGGVIGNLGHQLTTGVTKEKLKMNWHQAGKPTDSDQLSAWLVKQGVPIGVVNGVYEKMGLPVSAVPTTPTEPQAKTDGATEPQAKTGGAQRLMPFNNINPATGKRWTVDDLEAERNAQAKATTDTDATADTDAAADTTTAGAGTGAGAGAGVFGNMATQLAARPTTSSTGGTTTGVSGVGTGVVRHTASATNPNQPKPATPATKPAVEPTVPTSTATLPAGGGAGVRAANPFGAMASSLSGSDKAAADLAAADLENLGAAGAAPAAKKVRTASRIPKKAPVAETQQARRIAQALSKPVQEMLALVETKEDVKQIKDFIDQTFVRHGAVNESTFAVRNIMIEHVTQVGAQRRREFARKS